MNELIFKEQNCSLITRCRLCGGPIQSVLNFGYTPLANSYPKTQEEDEDAYPLNIMRCEECEHIQLGCTVKPEILFSNYLYSSSDSPALVKHFEDYASEVTSVLALKSDDRILEIGSNDGVLLRPLEALGFRRLFGVEPANNLSFKAWSEHIIIYPTFFDHHAAAFILESSGPMKLICANNVFAHVDKLDSMMRGIKLLLDKNGSFVFENAYLLNTIHNLYFDQIYHEHLQYYGIKPLVRFFNSYDMEIWRVEFNEIQGGSFRIFVQHKGGPNNIQVTVGGAIAKEELYALYNPQTYINFAVKLKKLHQRFRDLIERTPGTFSCYGCPAKFTLFSMFFDLANTYIKYVVDDSPLKQGRFSPGAKIPIVSRDHFRANPTDYCIVSAWNMAKPIMEKNKDYPGKFIVPMPEPIIIDK